MLFRSIWLPLKSFTGLCWSSVSHLLSVELHDDQHNPVNDLSGNQIKDSVSITTH